MCRLSRSIILLLAIIASVEATIPKGKLVEWDLNLFNAANSNDAGDVDCGDHFDILCPPGHKAGYFEIEDTGGGRMFYMYFPNRYGDDNAPFVFWTNGGPGSSSLIGLFHENGPYEVQKDLTLKWREHGWDVGHNIVFVEQPLRVGYSEAPITYSVTTEEQVGDNMVSFFYSFLKEHPELAQKDLYISGESYAGHYLPAIGRSIINANNEGTGTPLKLKAVVMGNPWTSPSFHYRSDLDFGVENGLITDEIRTELVDNYWYLCQLELTICDLVVEVKDRYHCQEACQFCRSIFFAPVRYSVKNLNYYDIRRTDCVVSGCYDFSRLTRFMNLDSVKLSIGVSDGASWRRSDRNVSSSLYWDVGRDMVSVVADILNDGINVFVYAGNKDLICNYLGNKRWIDNMQWDGAKDWALAEEKEWKLIDGTLAGTVRQSGLLTFMVIYDAGHLVPMDQPKVALDMLTTYTRGGRFQSKPKMPPDVALLTT